MKLISTQFPCRPGKFAGCVKRLVLPKTGKHCRSCWIRRQEYASTPFNSFSMATDSALLPQTSSSFPFLCGTHDIYVGALHCSVTTDGNAGAITTSDFKIHCGTKPKKLKSIEVKNVQPGKATVTWKWNKSGNLKLSCPAQRIVRQRSHWFMGWGRRDPFSHSCH